MADFGSPEKLRAALENTLNNQAYAPHDAFEEGYYDENDDYITGKYYRETHCNLGVIDVLQQGGDNSLSGLADLMYNDLSNPKFADELSFEEGVEYAKKGVTVFMARPGYEDSDGKHLGHIVLLSPEDMVEGSSNWNRTWVYDYGDNWQNSKRLAYKSFSKKKPKSTKIFILKEDRASADKRNIPTKNICSFISVLPDNTGYDWNNSFERFLRMQRAYLQQQGLIE